MFLLTCANTIKINKINKNKIKVQKFILIYLIKSLPKIFIFIMQN